MFLNDTVGAAEGKSCSGASRRRLSALQGIPQLVVGVGEGSFGDAGRNVTPVQVRDEGFGGQVAVRTWGEGAPPRPPSALSNWRTPTRSAASTVASAWP